MRHSIFALATALLVSAAARAQSFDDNFARCTTATTLGPSWITTGTWSCESGHARGESALGMALADTPALEDTDVSALVQLDGSTGSGVLARVYDINYYAARLNAGTGVDLVRVNGSTTTVLASQPMSLTPDISYLLELRVTGVGPVMLQVLVNGQPTLSGSDSSANAVEAGSAGLLSGSNARSQYRNFALTGTAAITFYGNFTGTDLGSSWITTGTWSCESAHARGQTAGGLALADTPALGDTDVSALVQLDGSTGSGVVARASGGNYYAVRQNAGAGIDLVRVVDGTTTELATQSETLTPDSSYRLELHVSGTGPVTLQVLFNGELTWTIIDASTALPSGLAGMLSGSSVRTQYSDFMLTGAAAAQQD